MVRADGRRAVIERRVRPDGIVVFAPTLNQHFSLTQRREDLAIQKFVSEIRVQALAIAVLPGTFVEDNPELRALSFDRLKRLGYEVIEADSGPAALAMLDAGRKIDLIFSDIVLPGGMSGYELARLARERFPLIKILLASGYDAELAAEQDTSAAELKILSKPYKQADLARALRERSEVDLPWS